MWVLDLFSILKKYEENKVRNMLYLMLNSRFENLQFNLIFIDEEGVSIVEDYNKPHLFPMLLKYHHEFTPCAKM